VTCDLDIVTFFRQFYLAFHTPTCGGYHANSWRAPVFLLLQLFNPPPLARHCAAAFVHPLLYRRL